MNFRLQQLNKLFIVKIYTGRFKIQNIKRSLRPLASVKSTGRSPEDSGYLHVSVILITVHIYIFFSNDGNFYFIHQQELSIAMVVLLGDVLWIYCQAMLKQKEHIHGMYCIAIEYIKNYKFISEHFYNIILYIKAVK